MIFFAASNVGVKLLRIFAFGLQSVKMSIHKSILRWLGWQIVGDMPDVSKSVVVMAPHTSYFDAVIGKMVLRSYNVPHRLLAKKELFFFPMNIVMRCLGAVPIRGIKGKNSIFAVTKMLREADSLHVVICPEGGFKPTDDWDMGFYVMAKRAEVPITVAFIDYKQRKAGTKAVIYDLDDPDTVVETLAKCYEGVSARHPENFMLPKSKRQKESQTVKP